MKTTEYIKNIIDRFPKGYVLTSSDFVEMVEDKEPPVKALNRLAAAGRIAKFAQTCSLLLPDGVLNEG